MSRKSKYADEEFSADDLLLAAEWLDGNEGGEDESGPCKRVAAWLRKEAKEREDEQIVRQLAEESGASIPQARAAWKRHKAKH